MRKNLLRNILVTGGAGYIGAITTNELKDQGYNPIVVDNLSTGHREHVNAKFYKIDLLDKKGLHKIFEKEHIDAVMHFASLAIASDSMRDPYQYYSHNINATLNLLDTMTQFKVPNIIFSSSCSIYGTPKHLPIVESDNIMPESPYASTKAIIEQILSMYKNTNGIISVCLRYFNAAGATLDGKLGEKHAPETHLIPSALRSLLERKPFQIYGNTYKTPDGTCIRDFVHVTDIARAHVQALSYLEKYKKSNAFNLGSGKGYSVLEVINSIESQTGEKISLQIQDARPGDPSAIYADSTKAKKELKWTPQQSDLKTIIKSALEWHTKHGFK